MKTPKIHILSDEIINKIAAGEVIERPASVVKELIENALDARSSFIKVQIEEGGKKKITITDNGEGMSPEDLKLCYLRHTTSKLSSADDLFHLRTNGFRGEAVASVAAISKMTITSKTTEATSAHKIQIQAGEIQKIEEVSAPQGTSFVIEDLFFNTPVRRNFLSSESAESTRILDVIVRIAIAHPEIRFEYRNESKETFTGVEGDLRSRLAETIGSGIAKKLIPVNHSENNISISGFISPPDVLNGKKNRHFLYLKNRPIWNPAVIKAVQKAYEPYGKLISPVSVLFLDMPDMDFDVNVHPAKKEVRFVNDSSIYSTVYRAIRNTLQEESSSCGAPVIHLSENSFSSTVQEPEKSWSSTVSQKPLFQPKSTDKEVVTQDLFSLPEFGKIIPLSQKSFEIPDKTPLYSAPSFLQLADTYIVCQDMEGLLLIDQSAAHARILYEQAIKTLESDNVINSQELLFPELIELSKVEKSLLIEILPDLRKLGFYLEPFGGDTYQIRGIPSGLSFSRAEKCIHEFLDSLQEDSPSSKIPLDSTAKAWASTTAYRANEKLNNEEMSSLVNQLLQTKEPLVSPYGKPTLLRIPIEDIHKKFKR
jgi:DNA mismatch repair protein MutL